MADPRQNAIDPSDPTTFLFRLTRGDRAALERAQADRGDDSLADTLRALPTIWTEHQCMLRAILDGVRGRLTGGEVDLILDALNGLYLAHEAGLGEMLGQHLGAEVEDGIRLTGLAKKHQVYSDHLTGLAKKHQVYSDHLLGALAKMTRVECIAIELWCAQMWRRSEDDDYWASERAWLATSDDAPPF